MNNVCNLFRHLPHMSDWKMCMWIRYCHRSKLNYIYIYEIAIFNRHLIENMNRREFFCVNITYNLSTTGHIDSSCVTMICGIRLLSSFVPPTSFEFGCCCWRRCCIRFRRYCSRRHILHTKRRQPVSSTNDRMRSGRRTIAPAPKNTQSH